MVFIILKKAKLWQNFCQGRRSASGGNTVTRETVKASKVQWALLAKLA